MIRGCGAPFRAPSSISWACQPRCPNRPSSVNRPPSVYRTLRCMQVLTTAPISPHRCPNRPSSGSRTPITNRALRRRSRRARLDLRTREPFLGTSRYSSPGRRQRHLLASLPAPSSTGRRCRLGRRCGPARENFVIIDHSIGCLTPCRSTNQDDRKRFRTRSLESVLESVLPVYRLQSFCSLSQQCVFRSQSEF